MELTKVFADFTNIREQYELKRTLEVVANGDTYRLEVLYCYSNPKSRWIVYAYSPGPSGWKRISEPGFPWVENQDEESAVRSALDFVEQQKSN